MVWSPFLLLLGAQSVLAKCKCTPGDDCWPATSSWDQLNTTVNGKLIRNLPLAEPCYPGPGQDFEACQTVASTWTNSTINSMHPVGYSYPLYNTCPLINTTVPEYPTCDLGPAPAYTINATEPADVAAGIKFAKDNNIRLVVKNTGHDLEGRSQGHGSLMVWIKYIQKGVHFHEKYQSSAGCSSNWTGSAFTVGGGYVWKDVYDAAHDHGHVVVGGGDPTVGVIGGYLQGGGHGPLSHDYGLGTDQVLELTVVLASGETVTANACQHADLFTALRGGGGSTYGIVTSATIKAYPSTPILQHVFSITPLKASPSDMVNVTANVMSKFPIFSDAGLSGFGYMRSGAYEHKWGRLVPNNGSASIEKVKSLVNKQLVEPLIPHNGTKYFVTSSWTLQPSFKEYRAGDDGSPIGTSNVMMTSRLFDKTSLLNNEQKLDGMLRAQFSKHDNGTLSYGQTELVLCLIGGGKVLEKAPHTSVHPSWRKAYLLFITVGRWPGNADAQEIRSYKEDLTFRKSNAMKALTPGMGTYSNEADRNDPAWRQDFWGPNYSWLKSMKEKYDPDHVFWCHPCVGSEEWVEQTHGRKYGPLCQRK